MSGDVPDLEVPQPPRMERAPDEELTALRLRQAQSEIERLEAETKWLHERVALQDETIALLRIRRR